ncbi:MAG TPA: mannose-1-phosphate guanylyltransferase/mannose-6-phosphate isomerase, partial [Chromatiales bacterium]|nr:mannose-1-phosphate guanylyltransferase/mannose-6-phosphate isomerase [Chromatiales bacterium]
MIPVILSGGSGTRLWPLSRNSYPKQFLSLVSPDESLFQSTVQRVRGVTDKPPIVVCNEQHRFLVAEQLRLVDAAEASIILEPVGKNTAPAAALAALLALEEESDEPPLLLVLPSDHLIQAPGAFSQAINSGTTKAADGDIVTFGIV